MILSENDYWGFKVVCGWLWLLLFKGCYNCSLEYFLVFIFIYLFFLECSLNLRWCNCMFMGCEMERKVLFVYFYLLCDDFDNKLLYIRLMCMFIVFVFC